MSATPPAGDELGTVVDIVDTLEELVGSGPPPAVHAQRGGQRGGDPRAGRPHPGGAARRPGHAHGTRSTSATRSSNAPSARWPRSPPAPRRRRRGWCARRRRRRRRWSTSTRSSTAATEQARALVADAEQHAAAQRAAADDYAREVMQRLEEQLERWLGTVREGLQVAARNRRAPRGRRRKR